MTDNLYDNFNYPEDDERNRQLNDAPQNAGASDDSAGYAKTESLYQPYTDPYADRASYRHAEQPAQDQTYRNPYRTADASSYTRPASTPTPTPEPAPTPRRSDSDIGDGYYQDYSRSSVNSNNVYSSSPASVNRASAQWSSSDPGSGNKGKKKSGGGISKGGVALLLVICILISGLAGFGGSVLAQKINQSKFETNDSGTMVIHKVNTEKEEASGELVDKSTETITNEVADSVVEITTEVMQTNAFYGQYIAQGAGSGVIISKDGYIVTNNHVIDGAKSIKVTTRGGDSYDAKLIGKDAKVDIALLKIEATDLPVAVVGDSDKLVVGSKAVIIGNPLGTLGGSVTEGIISALDRAIVIDGKTMHLMQTDAAINPGNSGGGMFDGQGALSGIVVAKTSSEGIDNIGFVIPINDVMDIIDDLKDYGYVRGRADTGMTFIDLSNNLFAMYYYGASEAGVYVNSVEKGSNAAKAGFEKGDRIVSIDGDEVKTTDDITTVINDKSAGDKVKFEIDRGGNTKEIELTLDEDIPDEEESSSNSDGNSDKGNSETPFGNNPFSSLW